MTDGVRKPQGIFRLWAERYASIVVLILIWELFVQAEWINAFLLPAVSSVLMRGWEEFLSGDILKHTGLTIYRALLSYLIGGILGVTVGTMMSRSRGVRWFFDPLVSVGFPAPKISFMPIFILWFGLYDLPKIVMTSFACVFPIISATYLGTASVDKFLLWSARAMGTSERKLLWQIIIPAAMPQILNGLQIAFPVALIVAVVTEMLSSGGGLGGYMILAARFADSEKVFLGIMVIALVGYALMALFSRFRMRVLSWHKETQMVI